MSKVSVILPVYNMANTLLAAVRSVVKQDHHNLELVIVDDGSTDNSLQVAHQLQRKHDGKNLGVVVYSKEHNGRSGALNKGIRLSTGAYVCFLDADDDLPEDSISLRVQHLDLRVRDDVVFAQTAYVNSLGEIPEVRLASEFKFNGLKQKWFRALRLPVILNSALYRRNALLKVGGV